MNVNHSETGSINKSRKLRATLRATLLIAIVFTALAHGAVESWSVFIFELLMLFVVTLWIVVALREHRLVIEVPGAALPFAALIGVGLLQSIAFSNAAGVLRSLSKDVEATRSAVIMLASMLVAFVATATFFESRRRLWRVAYFLTFFGMAMALFGLIQHFTWNGKLYWLRPITVTATSVFGPFVNHNDFAGYMELLFGLPVGLIITRAVRGEKAVLLGFASATMVIATFASLSRGGIASLLVGVIFLAAMAAVTLRKRKSHRIVEPSIAGRRGRRFASAFARVGFALGVIAILFMGAYWVGPQALVDRLTKGQVVSSDAKVETLRSSRGWIWEGALRMIEDNPVLGVGIGAFETAFPIYTSTNGTLRVPQAHNDYLQVLSDSGVVGGILAIWFLVVVFRSIKTGARSNDPVVSGLAIGTATGIIAILVHSFVDFNLQIPSNGLLFLSLVAMLSVVAGKGARSDSSTALISKGSRSGRALTAKIGR